MSQLSLIKQAKEVLTTTSTIAMFFSCTIFFWYFFKINYYPASDFLSNITLLLMVGSTVALFLIAIIAPIWFSSHLWHVALTKKSNQKLLTLIIKSKDNEPRRGKRFSSVVPIFLLNIIAMLLLAIINLISSRAAIITWSITFILAIIVYLPASSTKLLAKRKFKNTNYRAILDVMLLSICTSGFVTLTVMTQ